MSDRNPADDRGPVIALAVMAAVLVYLLSQGMRPSRLPFAPPPAVVPADEAKAKKRPLFPWLWRRALDPPGAR